VVTTNFKKNKVKLSPEEYEKKKKAILERDGYRCRLCLSMQNLTIDHIIKRSQGGGDTDDNLRTLCMTCHNKEDNSTSDQSQKVAARIALRQTTEACSPSIDEKDLHS
jgi:5-methylcytosine-specific restriction endonuclease McrA